MSNQRAYIDRSAILGAADLQTEEVHVPEWGGWVRVTALSASARDQFESDSITVRGKQRDVNLVNLRARLVALSVVDENGNRLFQEGDVHALGQKSASAIVRVFDVASRLSGIADDDVEELAGNSDAAPSGGSSSG